AIRVRCWSTNRIRGFVQLGKGQGHMGRSGRGHGQHWWFKDHNVFPRCLAWGDTNNRFKKQNYDELLGEGSNPKVRLTVTPDKTNQEWWKRLHEYFDESLSAYENFENSENKRGEYADLDKGVSSYADAGLHTVEMESTKLKVAIAYLQKENDAPHEKVKQELSYVGDDFHTMALDEDAKECNLHDVNSRMGNLTINQATESASFVGLKMNVTFALQVMRGQRKDTSHILPTRLKKNRGEANNHDRSTVRSHRKANGISLLEMEMEMEMKMDMEMEMEMGMYVGDDPEKVKMKLKQWAKLVCYSILETSSNNKNVAE
nr:hypothetical protein [Tanacetum cinerariifolium]